MMRYDSPLRNRHETWAAPRRPDPEAVAHRAGAAQGMQAAPPPVEYVPYGPPEAGCEIVATFGDPEAEYAAIRRGAGLLDSPHRGTLLITGDERVEFLDRMVTQKLAGLQAGQARETFWLNRKGRLDADLLLAELSDRMLADVDVHAAAPAASSLNEFIFAEDVEIADATGRYHRVALHGPAAGPAVSTAAGAPVELEPLGAATVTIGGAEVAVVRRDATGSPGLELFMPRDAAEAVWDALLAADEALDGRVRPVGWYAFNIARVEAGTPLFNIDFGATNLPHETGLLEQRVSFDKGCYLGQEIVARTHHLGRPKQMLVGLRPQRDRLPEAGGAVHAAEGDGPGEQIGTVTSSTLSPMLGAAPVAFAMVKTAAAAEGDTVVVEAEGEHVPAIVTPLRFWGAGP